MLHDFEENIIFDFKISDRFRVIDKSLIDNLVLKLIQQSLYAHDDKNLPEEIRDCAGTMYYLLLSEHPIMATAIGNSRLAYLQDYGLFEVMYQYASLTDNSKVLGLLNEACD